MSRIIFKGGPWSNKEDALLQAALAKYGMKNWDRVASMLENRKTPQQCKDRWFMYLDPNVNKGEWTGDEEEKLVELQEAFPGQWELIAAQLKGRRAWQCEAHYHALVEATGGGKNAAPDALIADLRNRRIQQGGSGGGANLFDMAYETRAPRADAVDNDNKDEEMLATATARLGNQDGKKQSRDARKQQLKETSFLTTLQRGREMEESGTMSERLKLRRQRALEDDEAEGDNAADAGFAPIEVLQSAARHKKKDKLYIRAAQGGDGGGSAEEDDASKGGIDITRLFAPAVLPAAAPPRVTQFGSASSLLDWGAAGLGGEASVTNAAHRSAQFIQGKGSAALQPPRLAGNDRHLENLGGDDHIGEETLSMSRSLLEVAAQLIEAEGRCHTSSTGAQLPHDMIQRAERMIQQAAGEQHHQSDTKTPPSSATGLAQLQRDLLHHGTTGNNKRSRLQTQGRSSDVQAEVDRLRADVQREVAREQQLRNALHFYRAVCTPAEAAAAARRVEDAELALEEKRQHERHLQDDFARRRRLATIQA